MLLNNAGVAVKGHSFEGLDNWKAVMDVNLFGCVPLSFRAAFVHAPRPIDYYIVC